MDDTITWQVSHKKISDLRGLSANPRRLTAHDAAHLKTSITKFGLCEPIVINQDNIIIGGHQRIRILKKLGEKECDVMEPNRMLSQEEVNELCIRLNRNNGEWDFEILGNLWEPEDLVSWGFTEKDLGFDDEEKPVKPKKHELLLSFTSIDDLHEAKEKILAILEQYQGSTYRVK